MIPNPHISNNTNERLKVFQFATLNIWIKKECIISCLNLLLYCNATENLQNLLMLRTGTIWWRNTKDWKHTKQYRHHNRTKNGFRKSKKQSNVLSNSGYKPWYYATFLRIWGWPFKGCKQTDPTPSFFPCDYEYSWRIGTSQTHRDAESLVKKLRKNSKTRD